MTFELIGTGSYAPGTPVPNAALARVMHTSDEWIYKRSGIRQRHYAPEGVGASDLACEAAKRAIESAGISPRDIDYIVFATMTPDHIFPGPGALLAHKLGLDGVPALDIRQQCAAMIFGLQILDGLFKTGAARTVLLVGAEAHAGFMPWKDWSLLEPGCTRESSEEEKNRCDEHRALAVLFGDGAGALVFRATDRNAGLVKAKVHTDGGGGHLLYLKAGGFLTRPYMKAEMIEQGDWVPRMDGREVFRYAVTKLPETARALLEETKTSIDQVDWFLAHQANTRINTYIRDQLGVGEEKMPMNIERYGNTSAGTIPILIDELTRAKKLKKGELNMLLALGAGIHWGCALVRW
jgi:3-oxoacyl-[acyl-carrier-protein] synthase-3